MKITTTDEAGEKVVSFEGKIDTSTSPEAEGHLEHLLGEGATKILLDFERLVSISSAGLRVLVALSKSLKQSGGDLRVCSLNETVGDVFEITGFSTIFNVFETKDAALSGF